jgi:ring-1,2-phenylacetyl-CoA epoxidase subunit PaaE
MQKPNFYNLTVQEVRAETADCVSVLMQVPAHLQTQFEFTAGQYITFKKNIDSLQELRRSYSICAAPFENELRVAIKKVPEGAFSTYANMHLKAGDALEVMVPTGNFTYTPSTKATNYIGFVSGSGITPVLSIIKNILHTQALSTFTLVYGNKNLASIIFKEEIEALKNTFTNRLQVIHILSRERLEVDLNYGRISANKCEKLFDKLLNIKNYSEAFLCGPEEMILDVKDYLIANGMAPNQVKFELFGTAASYAKAKNKATETAIETGPTSKVSVRLDDRTFEMQLAQNGLNILDAALQAGADLPYACKGGVCCTCRAKVISGTVSMDVNYALEPKEVEQGYILTCQAHPTSAEVFVDFDVT